MCIKDEREKLPTVSAENRSSNRTTSQCNVWLEKREKRTRTSGNQMGMTIDIEHEKGKWSEDISLK